MKTTGYRIKATLTTGGYKSVPVNFTGLNILQREAVVDWLLDSGLFAKVRYYRVEYYRCRRHIIDVHEKHARKSSARAIVATLRDGTELRVVAELSATPYTQEVFWFHGWIAAGLNAVDVRSFTI